MSEELRPMTFQGLGATLARWGYSFDPRPLADRPIATVESKDDGEHLVFTFQDGATATFTAEGDCCSRSWIEHLTVPPDIAGTAVTHVGENDMGERDTDDGYGLLRLYQTTFRTPKGDIVVEYRNESNGYYGGWLSGPTVVEP